MLKKQVEKYPNAERASPHFRWTELIVSASAPRIALKYAKAFSRGWWPSISDPFLWANPNDSRLRDLKNKMSPKMFYQPVSQTMADHLSNLVEPLRAHLGGRPMTVISGWRPPELNTAVGGARLSGHMIGVATDFEVDRATSLKAREWAKERDRTHHDIGFFKIYSWGFHIGSLRGYADHIIK